MLQQWKYMIVENQATMTMGEDTMRFRFECKNDDDGCLAQKIAFSEVEENYEKGLNEAQKRINFLLLIIFRCRKNTRNSESVSRENPP